MYVRLKTLTPTLQPLFIALSQVWSGYQDEVVLLSVLSNLLSSLSPFTKVPSSWALPYALLIHISTMMSQKNKHMYMYMYTSTWLGIKLYNYVNEYLYNTLMYDCYMYIVIPPPLFRTPVLCVRVTSCSRCWSLPLSSLTSREGQRSADHEYLLINSFT